MKKALFLVLLIVSCCFSAQASEITLNVKESFGIGEKIEFEYVFLADYGMDLTYAPYIYCLNVPLPFMVTIDTYLEKDVPYTKTFSLLTIDDSIEPQTCTAYVQILSPIQQRIEKTFKIETNPSFPLSLLTCKNPTCTQKSKTFILGEKIYFDYASDIKNLEITATLTYPDKKTLPLTLPASIKASQIGTYTLEVTASKEGYKTITKKQQFAVIPKQAEIQKADFDKIIYKNENGKEKASNPATGKATTSVGRTQQYLSILIILILGAIIIFLFRKKNNKK